jgi:hypothetical protein
LRVYFPSSSCAKDLANIPFAPVIRTTSFIFLRNEGTGHHIL